MVNQLKEWDKVIQGMAEKTEYPVTQTISVKTADDALKIIQRFVRRGYYIEHRRKGETRMLTFSSSIDLADRKLFPVEVNFEK